jgi:hypothetical protein
MDIVQCAQQLIALHLGAHGGDHSDLWNSVDHQNDVELQSFLLDSASTSLSLFVSKSKVSFFPSF